MSVATIDDDELPPYGHIVAAALLVMLGLVATIGGWAMFARLDAAVVSYGVVHADSERKSVEHLEGGILSDLLVRAGDRVEEGQIVARLDATQIREILTQLRAELTATRFAIWRLNAEAAGHPPEVAAAPDDPWHDAQTHATLVAAELALYEARLGNHQSQVASLDRQIDRLRAEIAASAARRDAADRQLALWEDEREQVAELVARGAAPSQRLLEFDRAVALIEGDRDEQTNLAEAARQDVARAESDIRALQHQRQVEIVATLVEAHKAVETLQSQIRAAEDSLSRRDLRAPQSGRVVEISVVTPGAVVGPGEPLLTILPEEDTLVALTRLPPSAIDSIAVGGPAEVRLTAFKRADAPIVPGIVSYVSADALTNQDGETYFEARVTLDEDAVAALEGVTLVAGMPLEVSLTVGERRAGDYFVEPLLRRFGRAFHEE